MHLLNIATDYAKRGWIVHRVRKARSGKKGSGKAPIDGGWQKVTTPPTEAKLEEWFGDGNPNGYNIGLLCGEASGITVIDLDRMIYADIFAGVKTLRSTRTEGRGHVFFKYHQQLKASKHHNLGIEVLSTGNNVILPPSRHASGDEYQWVDPADDVVDMPDEVVVKLNNLFQREKNLNNLIKKCRPCFAKLWKKEVRETTDFHGAAGRELMLAWGADLKAAGATLADGEMWARVIYGEDHDMAKTLTEWRHIDQRKTWRCETVVGKLGGVIECGCGGCKWNPPQTSPEKTATLDAVGAALEKKFDTFEIVEALQKENPIIYDKTKQFWMWSKDDLMYIPVDETDVLNMLKNVMGVRGGVIGAARSTYLQAIKLTGREVVVGVPDKNWVAFKNCVVDIMTGAQFNATSEYMFTNTIPHNYSDSEETPTLDILFTDWVGKEFVPLLYEIAAYCLYNGYPIHRAFLLFGSGRNGKGQYAILLQRWLGMANITSSSLDRLVGSLFQASKLYEKKACFMGETNFGTMNKTDTFKMLTGADMISGERKYGTPFDFYNQAKLIIATNNIPDSDDKTEGFGSRWTIVDFPNKFEEGIPVIDTIPEWEYDNLCRKSVRILRELLARGIFTGEGDTRLRTKRYEEKSNPIQKFIGEYCVEGDNLSTPLWTFYEKYAEYQEENRLRSITKKAVSKWLRNRGYDVDSQKVDGRNWVWVFGLDMAVEHKEHKEHVLSKSPIREGKTLETTCSSCSSCSQANHMKKIDRFFREHRDRDGKNAEITYASQKQLMEFVPQIAEQLHIKGDVAFRLIMEYGKDRGWI